MLLPRGIWFVLLGWAGGASAWAATTPTRAAEWPLPPVSGEVTGNFAPTFLSGAPPLAWKLSVRAGESAAVRVADLVVEGPGLRATGLVRLTAKHSGTWRLDAGEMELARWFALLAPSYFPTFVGAMVEGLVKFSGEGTLRDGQLAGRLALEVRDAALRNDLQGWSLRGVTLTGALGQLPAVASDGKFRLTFAEASVANLVARDGAIEFSIDGEEKVQVASATCAMLDGRVEVTPFSFPLAAPAVQADVHFKQIELGQIAALLPPVLSAATGKISGRMALAWSAQGGVQPGSGRLRIDPGSAVSFRLAPQPGFFTDKVPKKIALLPDKLGALAKLVSVDNPAFEPLRAIEMGEIRLEVNSLDIGFSPEGDADGRTARVVITARPEKREEIESVRFEVNVKGPLADVLRLGIEHGVSVRTR